MKMEEAHAHQMSISLGKETPAEVVAGTDMTLRIAVSCSSACELRGRMVRVVGEDAAVLHEVELTQFDGAVNETDEFVVKTPIKLGQCAWMVEFSEKEEDDVHGKSSAPFAFTVKPHSTSISVWDVPATIPFGEKFKVKAGVKCSLECKLTDKTVGVYNHEGTKLATATVGDVDWTDDPLLSCAEVELQAPAEEETRYRWKARLLTSGMEIPHAEAECTFAFGTASKADLVVTVEIIDNETKAPMKNATVVLRPAIYRGNAYMSRSDDSGVARVSVPKGKYHINATNDGYKTFMVIEELSNDTFIKAELDAGDDIEAMMG
jgi:hypothetical protein